jgi:5-(aminomethyl)-3-furanmethanol phosphate kinase
MWVVKLGGSLGHDPKLALWLEQIAELGGGRVVVVPGGGRFADQVRSHQSVWRFADVAAHNMAVLAMAQTGFMMQALAPRLALARDETQVVAALRAGQAPVWLPFDLLRSSADEITRWSVSSDSLAAWLANRLNAERLIVVKSCEIDPAAELARQSELGVLDSAFGEFTADAAYPVQLLSRSQLDVLRMMLLAPERVSETRH